MQYSYSTEAFEKAYTYLGNDLGANWTPEMTLFRLWAPTAQSAQINLYESGNALSHDLIRRIPMVSDINGTWVATAEGNLNGIYYTFTVSLNGTSVEACDPYARTTGVNGSRAMVIDLERTNPAEWENDRNPHSGSKITDAVICELHIRDFSIDSHSGVKHRGKYLGVVESGTKTKSGIPTCLDHLKELGITHLHLLPMYDYGSVDEDHPEKAQYNWGYDPVNFNVPEGSYSTDPWHGEIRVCEMKKMIKELHSNGISVIMDVVYNHVYHTDEFCFNQLVPRYFSRFDQNGKLTNASCCGNDTASERTMVRKYIVDSVNYWADEYHIDGFRFDLVGLIDTVTINEIMRTVHRKHPDIIFYGEGWDMAQGITKKNVTMTTQKNANLVPGFAFFNDTIRDTLRGSVFDMTEKGYLCGGHIEKASIDACFLGTPNWTSDPCQVVNYISCHDNHTLFDRLTVALPDAPREELIRRNNLGAAFCILSQGIPFFQAGEELLRSKPSRSGTLIHNSYNASDRVNSIKWEHLNDPAVLKTSEYYRGLIEIRKQYPILREHSKTQEGIQILLHSCESKDVAAYLLCDSGSQLLIVFNSGKNNASIALPEGSWKILAQGNQAGITALGIANSFAIVPALSAMVLCQSRDM